MTRSRIRVSQGRSRGSEAIDHAGSHWALSLADSLFRGTARRTPGPPTHRVLRRRLRVGRETRCVEVGKHLQVIAASDFGELKFAAFTSHDNSTARGHRGPLQVGGQQVSGWAGGFRRRCPALSETNTRLGAGWPQMNLFIPRRIIRTEENEARFPGGVHFYRVQRVKPWRDRDHIENRAALHQLRREIAAIVRKIR